MNVPFFDLFTSLMDLPAKFFLENIQKVFQDRDIWTGQLEMAERCRQFRRHPAHRADDHRGCARRHRRAGPDPRRASIVPQHPSIDAPYPHSRGSRPFFAFPRQGVARKNPSEGQRVHRRAYGGALFIPAASPPALEKHPAFPDCQLPIGRGRAAVQGLTAARCHSILSFWTNNFA